MRQYKSVGIFLDTHIWGMGMVQNAVFRARNRDIVVGNIVTVVQESVRKVATWATHGREKERYAIGSGGAAHRCNCTIPLTWAKSLNSSNSSTSRLLFLIMRIYVPSPAPGLSPSDSLNTANWMSSNPDFSRTNQSLGGSLGSGGRCCTETHATMLESGTTQRLSTPVYWQAHSVFDDSTKSAWTGQE